MHIFDKNMLVITRAALPGIMNNYNVYRIDIVIFV